MCLSVCVYGYVQMVEHWEHLGSKTCPWKWVLFEDKSAMKQVLPHGLAFKLQQKIWMKYKQFFLSHYPVENGGLSVPSQCNAEKAEPIPLPSTELKFQ